MRGSIAAAAAVFLLRGLVGPGLAQGIGLSPPVITGPADIQNGTVTSVDSAAMDFACHEQGGERTYWVTRATRFRAGRSDASFWDLKTGRPVEVVSHASGNRKIADLVVLRT